MTPVSLVCVALLESERSHGEAGATESIPPNPNYCESIQESGILTK